MVKSEKNTLKCKCKGFEYACICSCNEVVAERDSLLNEFLEQVKSNRRKRNKSCSSDWLAGVGRKGQQQEGLENTTLVPKEIIRENITIYRNMAEQQTSPSYMSTRYSRKQMCLFVLRI